jgi:hypothetical protein
MKPSRKAKVLDSSRMTPAEPPAETRSPAIGSANNTFVYIGETKGPKPTKYFVTVYFDVPEQAG